MTTYEVKYRIGEPVYSRATHNGPFEIMAIVIRSNGVYYDLLHRGVRFELPEKTLTPFLDVDHVSSHHFQD